MRALSLSPATALHTHHRRRPPAVPPQNKLLGGLGGFVGGQACSVQLEFKRADGQLVPTVTVKTKKDDTETLPLYTNKDSVLGEVR